MKPSRPHFRVRLGRVRQEAIARILARMPRAALRLLPGTSLSFGPPRRSARIRDYLLREPGEWRPLLPSAASDYLPPHSLPKDSECLRRKFFGTIWNELGVAVIPDGRVLDDHAWPVGRDDTFLYEFGFLGERPICPIFLTTKLDRPIRLRGSALNLGSCWAAGNYGHFVLDALPRLELFLRSGFSLDAIDHFILPNFLGPSAEKLVAELGLPLDKMLRPRRGEQYAFDTVYQPSYPGSSAYYHPLVAEFYRRVTGRKRHFSGDTNPSSSQKRRLYVPRRGGTRQILNEPEIERVLHRHGFETVDFRNVADEPALFAQAEIVVGPHGAGLANVVFCSAGAKLLELIPSNHVYPFYYSAACAADMDYWGLIGPAAGPTLPDDFAPPNDADFHIEPSDLEAVLSAMGAGRRDS